MQKRIKEGSDVGAFFSEWHRLLGAVRAVSLVLECSDQAVRTWLYDGTAPSAATRAMMRIITPKMTKLPDKAWTTLKSWEIYQQMQAN